MVDKVRLCISLVVLAVLPGCGKNPDDKGEDTSVEFDTYEPDADNDADGWTVEEGDCADDDATIHPGQEEDCNGIDDNCNDVVDETFPDTDEDGTADCQDAEECDGLDNDGDGDVDEGFDADGDGVADCMGGDEVCDGVDNDGDGDIDEGFDVDGDGYTQCGTSTSSADCDDDDAGVNPGASEVADDLVDNDCDGLVDEGAWSEGDLFLTEIMNNPRLVVDPDGEWFEVYNNTESTVVLNGLVIYSADGDWHQVLSDDLLLLDPADYFVFGNNDDLLTNGGVELDYSYGTDISLANESDELIIEADGVIIDTVVWDDGETFPDAAGSSMTLDPTFYGPDLNDTGDYWCKASRKWGSASDYGTPGDTNQFCWPVAIATVDTSISLYTCDSIQLDGSASTDPESLPLTYEWELTSAPSGSSLTTADIETTTDMMPTFVADLAGTYVFTLTVYNEFEYSPPGSVSVVVAERPYNTSPVANAGSDQTYDEDAHCTPISYGVSYTCPDCASHDFDLDGSDSTDYDGDEVSDPYWIITSGTSYATISDEDTFKPTVTVTGPSATYGLDNAYTVGVQLEVSDCMAATGTDDVTLTFTCTGT